PQARNLAVGWGGARVRAGWQPQEGLGQAARGRRGAERVGRVPGARPGHWRWAKRGNKNMTTATAPQLIRVGHSPYPDDAFMFHALANDKIPTGRLRFVHELQDIETLNRRALR